MLNHLTLSHHYTQPLSHHPYTQSLTTISTLYHCPIPTLNYLPLSPSPHSTTYHYTIILTLNHLSLYHNNYTQSPTTLPPSLHSTFHYYSTTFTLKHLPPSPTLKLLHTIPPSLPSTTYHHPLHSTTTPPSFSLHHLPPLIIHYIKPHATTPYTLLPTTIPPSLHPFSYHHSKSLHSTTYHYPTIPTLNHCPHPLHFVTTSYTTTTPPPLGWVGLWGFLWWAPSA